MIQCINDLKSKVRFDWNFTMLSFKNSINCKNKCDRLSFAFFMFWIL